MAKNVEEENTTIIIMIYMMGKIILNNRQWKWDEKNG